MRTHVREGVLEEIKPREGDKRSRISFRETDTQKVKELYPDGPYNFRSVKETDDGNEIWVLRVVDGKGNHVD